MIEGDIHPDFQPVAACFAALLEHPQGGGGAACVLHRGEPVIDIWAGTDADGAPFRSDTMVMSFSTTKGVVATLVHLLVDRRLLDYEDPVAKHWPEFAQAGKERITVRDLLCHQSGLHGISSRIDHAERMLDWAHMTDVLARGAPHAEFLGRSAYHGLTWGWLVGELVQRVTRRSLSEVLRSELADPLSLDGAFIGVPEPERPRLAALLKPAFKLSWASRLALGLLGRSAAVFGSPIDPDRIRDAFLPPGCLDVVFSPRFVSAAVPAANGCFTARSLARIYSMLACAGKFGGRRLLGEETIHRATRVQSRRFDAIVGFPMLWRLGYHLVGTSRGILPKAFGHFGLGGSGAWADPSRGLSVALILNRVAGTPFGDMRLVRLSGAATACADARRKSRVGAGVLIPSPGLG